MNLREIFATFGLSFDQAGFDKAEGSIGKLKSVIKSFGAGLASAAAFNWIKNFVSAIADTADDLGDLAARTGVSADSLQRLGGALTTVGLDVNSTAMLLERMNVSLAGGSAGEGKFRRLGVETRDAAGQLRDTESVFLDVTDRVSQMGSAAERTAALQSVFGRGGRALAAALAGGGNQIREIVDSMGGLEGITQDVIESSGELENQTVVLEFAQTSLKNLLARELMPIAVRFVTTLVGLTRTFVQAASRSNVFKAVLVTLGTALVVWGAATAAAWLPATLTFLGIAAAIALVVLIVDDLITMFEGGDSAIGDFIDSMYGAGSSALLVEGIALAWDRVKEAVGGAVDAVKDYFGIDDTPIAHNMTAAEREAAARRQAAEQALADAQNQPARRPRGTRERERGTPGREAATAVTSPVGARREAVAPAPGRGGRAGTTIVQNTNTNLTIQGNPSREETRRVQAAVGEELDRRNREAAQVLNPVPEE